MTYVGRPAESHAMPRSRTVDPYVLPDGTTVRMRPIRTDDKGRILAMWARTSPQSRRMRFHGTYDISERNVNRFTDLDPDQEFALVATLGLGDDERIVGVSRYIRDLHDPAHAEFAVLVEDAQQGRGVGTALVREIAQAAHDDGVRTLTGDILAENHRMLALIRELGLDHKDRRESTVVRTDVGLDITEEFLRVMDDGERAAAKNALTRFFNPSSVAVVGASRNPKSIGGLVFRHILHGEFEGVLYPVNPNAKVVQSVRAYPDLTALPEPPDLVIVCVPAPLVHDVVRQAGDLGVRAVCIISAGFAEAGAEGVQRQDDLMALARSYGLRVVGPNCMGVMNAGVDVRMNGTFSSTFPDPGRLAFSSQSGALGLAVIEHAKKLGLGLSTFVSVGNKADISGNDLLLFWEDDPDTDVILLYLESFGNPRKFSRIARRISRRKPIVAVKSGRTSAGVRAASSHTAAISSGDVAVEALFAQAGVIRTDTLEELFDVATLLSSQQLPGGRRVGIVTNAGGPGILAADACESNGLRVPALSDGLQLQLLEFLPAEAGIANPVDMIASASADGYRRAIEALAASGEVDAVLVIFIPAGTTNTDEVAAALTAAAKTAPEGVSVVSVFMSVKGMPPELADAKIPSFSFPEDAARALGRVAQYADWRAKPLGKPVDLDDLDREGARAIMDAALRVMTAPGGKVLVGSSHAAASANTEDEEVGDGGGSGSGSGEGRWLTTSECQALLQAYGVPLARARIVTTADGAAEVHREFGGTVAVKLAAPIHKTDVGGIALGLTDPSESAAAVLRMEERLAELGMSEYAGSYMVQEMIDDGVEMVVGVTHDPSFGPLVMTGMGGTLVELLRDVSVRITPLTDRDADEMLASLRMRPLLEGYRGSPPADVPALKRLLHRIAAMVEDLPEIAELDLNPVFVRPEDQGVVAVDMRMKVTPAP